MPGCPFQVGTYAAAALWLEGSRVAYGDNPKRKETKSFDRYESYSKATTIGEALELGSLPEDLLFDFERGFLKVSEPLRETPLDLFSVKDFDELTFTDKTLAKWVHLASASEDQNSDQKIWVTKLEESLKKQKANMRRLAKITKAKALDVEVDSLADTTGNFETPTMAARRTMANAQAKDILEAVENENRAVTDYEILNSLRLWDFRENTSRQNVMKEGENFVYSDTVGLVANYVGGVVVKEECRRYPEFGKLLNRWLADNLPKDLGTEFVCTSININKNYAGRLHRDGNNLGPSFLKAFGCFKGGELNYYPEDDKSCNLEVLQAKHGENRVQLDVSDGLLLFDGKRAHFVNEFEGERYSLVFFTCPRFERISDEGRAYMDAAGFPFPTQESMEKLANALRKPKGYEGLKKQTLESFGLQSKDSSTKNESEEIEANGPEQAAATLQSDAPSIHDAAFLFYPHANPERDAKESHAEKYWTTKGLRTRLECAADYKSESRSDKQPMPWEERFCFTLPSEPSRKDLILESQSSKVDAVLFLNKPGSAVAQAIIDTGCCAVWSIRTKTWNALFKHGMKSQALEVFGMQGKDSNTKDDSEGTETNTPQKRKALESDDSTASSQKQCKGVLSMMLNAKSSKNDDSAANGTPPQKRKLLGPDETASDQKHRKIVEGGSAASFKVRDVVEVQQKFRCCNGVKAANASVGQRGSVVKIDATGDVLIHFHDNRNALQWVSKSDLAKLRLLPVPKSVPKRQVLKVAQQSEAASTTIKAATDVKTDEPDSKAATDPQNDEDKKQAVADSKGEEPGPQATIDSNKDEPDSNPKATTASKKDEDEHHVTTESKLGEPSSEAAANLKKDEEKTQAAMDSKSDEPGSKETAEDKRDEPASKAAAIPAKSEEKQQAATDSKSEQRGKKPAADSKRDAPRSKAATDPKREEEKKQRAFWAHTLLETYDDFSICDGDSCIEFTPNGKTETSHKKSFQRYAGYAKAKTFQEALDLGASVEDMLYDYQKGLLKIVTKGTGISSNRFENLKGVWKQKADKLREQNIQG